MKYIFNLRFWMIIWTLIMLHGAFACDGPAERRCDETFGDYYSRLQRQVEREYPDREQHHHKNNRDDENQ